MSKRRVHPLTLRVGGWFSCKRTRLGWPMAKVANEIGPLRNDTEDGRSGVTSEKWVARLETGIAAPPSRWTVEVLCDILRCTDEERAYALLLAGHTFIEKRDGSFNEVDITLNTIFAEMYKRLPVMVEVQLDRCRWRDLDDGEHAEIMGTVLRTIIRGR